MAWSKWANWRKFRALSPSERRLLLQAVCFLPLTALAVYCCGLRRWQALLAWLTPFCPAKADHAWHLVATPRVVRIAAAHGIWRGNCLQQSLTLWWLLRRQGIACELRIGVRKVSGCFEAHAWIEHQGVILNEGDQERRSYVPFRQPIVPLEMEVA